MLNIYGSPVSSPTNKVRYVANYLEIPHKFHMVNLGGGEQRSAAFLKINPLGKVPAIDDEGFTLAESNAIIRYLANKSQSSIYPTDLKHRAIVDQWIDYASMHIMISFSKIMYNTYFYKFTGDTCDERALSDGHKFVGQFLPHVDQQLENNVFLAGNSLSLADFSMLAAVDVAEMCQVDLAPYSHLTVWRNKLIAEKFYQQCHESFTSTFKNLLARVSA